VLYADHQTAGRGRLDRAWDAPPRSNLLVSLLFTSGDPVVLMRRVAIAAVDAVAATAGVTAELKWPNDVLVDGRKLAGLLAQRTAGATVIGVGLNVGWAPEGAARLGGQVTPADVLAALLRALDATAAATPDAVHERYSALLATLGQQVRVELPGGELVGRATGVARDGRLLVLDECAITHRVDVGDVVHLRPL
jgi:BirA family biotin operon repressor/biotin-[acetyl-CoA-carboxylase] ligase